MLLHWRNNSVYNGNVCHVGRTVCNKVRQALSSIVVLWSGSAKTHKSNQYQITNCNKVLSCARCLQLAI